MEKENQRKKNWVIKFKLMKNYEFLLFMFDKFKEKIEKNIFGVKVIINQIDKKIVIEG